MLDVPQKVADHLSAGSYLVSGGTTVFGVMGVNEFGILFGVVLATCTFILNWVYREKHYRLAKAKLEREKESKE